MDSKLKIDREMRCQATELAEERHFSEQLVFHEKDFFFFFFFTKDMSRLWCKKTQIKKKDFTQKWNFYDYLLTSQAIENVNAEKRI